LSLARAVYKNADIVLMDDPISAVDMTVRKRIFNQVFRGVLKDKTRILVTHAVDFIHLADKVILMKDGKVDAFGTPEDLEEHEYLKEIRSIHTKNRVDAKKKEEENQNELEAALDNETKSNADKSESSE
jgi:ABC-type multidrug transport system fused ATPase/permease subunit